MAHHIKIVSPAGSVTLEVQPGTFVAGLKACYASHPDFQGDKTRIALFFRGQELDDLRPIDDYPLGQRGVLTHKQQEGDAASAAGSGVDYDAVNELLQKARSASARGSIARGGGGIGKGADKTSFKGQGWLMKGGSGLPEADHWDSDEEERRARGDGGSSSNGSAGLPVPLRVEKPNAAAWSLSPPPAADNGHSPYASLAQLQTAAQKRQAARRKQREVEASLLRVGKDTGVQPIHYRALVDALPSGAVDDLDADETFPSGIAAAFAEEEQQRRQPPAVTYEEEQRKNVAAAKAAFEQAKREKQASLSLVPRKPETVIPYHAPPAHEGGVMRGPARELKQQYVCQVGPLKHTFRLLHLLEGRWTGEARLIKLSDGGDVTSGSGGGGPRGGSRRNSNASQHTTLQEDVKIATVDMRFDDTAGVWHEHQSFTSKEGLVAGQTMTLRPVGDGVCVVQLHTSVGGASGGSTNGAGSGDAGYFSPLKSEVKATGFPTATGANLLGVSEGGGGLASVGGYYMLLREIDDNTLTLTATSATTGRPLLIETIVLTGSNRIRTVQKLSERTSAIEAVYVISEERVIDVMTGAMMEPPRSAAGMRTAATDTMPVERLRPVSRAHHGMVPSFMPEGKATGPLSSTHGSTASYSSGDSRMFTAHDLRVAVVQAEREKLERERAEHAHQHHLKQQLKQHTPQHYYGQQGHQPHHQLQQLGTKHASPSSFLSSSGNPNIAAGSHLHQHAVPPPAPPHSASSARGSVGGGSRSGV